MAAVTVATGWPRTNVSGSMRELLYKITVVTTGDTLTLKGVSTIKHVSYDPVNNGITAMAATDRSGSTAAYLTFTGTAANTFVRVLGW